MANSQSHICEIADKKTAYNEGRLYLEILVDNFKVRMKFKNAYRFDWDDRRRESFLPTNPDERCCRDEDEESVVAVVVVVEEEVEEDKGWRSEGYRQGALEGERGAPWRSAEER